MRFGKFVVALGMASMLVAGSAFAAERGTPDEAKVLVEKAAAHLKAVGAEKAFADFNNPAAGYQDRDLFVFVYSVDGEDPVRSRYPHAGRSRRQGAQGRRWQGVRQTDHHGGRRRRWLGRVSWRIRRPRRPSRRRPMRCRQATTCSDRARTILEVGPRRIGNRRRRRARRLPLPIQGRDKVGAAFARGLAAPSFQNALAKG